MMCPINLSPYNLKFAFECQGNKIIINTKDSISEIYMSLNKRSDGFKWFLKIFTLINNIKNHSIILIDEPEKFLHASAQKELVKIFKEIKLKKNIQIIYVTHSPFLLTKDIYPSLKIVIKGKEQSEIFNNINSFINSNNKNIKDTMLPIALSLGINLFELHKLNNMEKFLFVEGEADIYMINIAKYLSNQDLKTKWNHFIWPMTGSENLYGIRIAEMYKFKFKILIDGKEEKYREYGKDKVNFISSLCENKEIINPEDILSKPTKQKYDIDKIQNEKKIKNHKIGWQKLYDDVITSKYELTNNEKSIFKTLFDNLLLFLENE